MTTGVPAADILIGIAAGVTALGVVLTALRATWRGFLRPIIRAAQKVNETLPVLVNIAEEFAPNDGHSLKDIITKIDANGEILSEYAHTAKHDTIGKIAALQGWQDVHGEQLDGFIEETTRRFEELGVEVSTVKGELAVVMTIIDRREEPR